MVLPDMLGDVGLPALSRRAWVEVDVDVLTANAAALAELATPAALGAVVKADGYGHGLEVAGRCAVAGGARWLCVANLGEATRLRRDGFTGQVFVLYPVPLDQVAVAAGMAVDVTVGSVGYAAALAERADDDHPVLAVHLEIDTGMTRGGVHPGAAVEAANTIIKHPRTRLAGLWTHLASPESDEATSRQMDLFQNALDDLRGAAIDPPEIHVAASAGLLASDTSSHTFVRLGLALYGVHPGAGDPLPTVCRPALALRAQAVRLTSVPAGTAVGYSGTWVAPVDSLIATLPLGYVDGWSRSSSPGSSALVEGRRAPLVGRVSSDAVTVDVTAVPGVDGDSVFTLLGDDGAETITADEVAAVRGTISWEVLQQLGTRLARVYTAGGVPVAVRGETTTEVVAADGTNPLLAGQWPTT